MSKNDYDYQSREDLDHDSGPTRNKKRIIEETESTGLKDETVPKTVKIGVVCNYNCVNMREEANPNSKVVKTLNRGDRVEILDKIGEYYRIKVKTEIGYISCTFCKEE